MNLTELKERFLCSDYMMAWHDMKCLFKEWIRVMKLANLEDEAFTHNFFVHLVGTVQLFCEYEHLPYYDD